MVFTGAPGAARPFVPASPRASGLQGPSLAGAGPGPVQRRAQGDPNPDAGVPAAFWAPPADRGARSAEKRHSITCPQRGDASRGTTTASQRWRLSEDFRPRGRTSPPHPWARGAPSEALLRDARPEHPPRSLPKPSPPPAAGAQRVRRYCRRAEMHRLPGHGAHQTHGARTTRAGATAQARHVSYSEGVARGRVR